MYGMLQVKNSNHMEPEGLVRCLHEVMKDDQLKVSTLATDRHVMVSCMMKKEPYNKVNIRVFKDSSHNLVKDLRG